MVAASSFASKSLVFALALPLLAGCATTRVTSDPLARGVKGQLLLPAQRSGTALPVVILLHGREGLRTIYVEEARWLAVHGYAVLVLDYYAGAPWGGFTHAERARRWRVWEGEVEAAAKFLETQSCVDPQRMALLGMSQGAALALTSRKNCLSCARSWTTMDHTRRAGTSPNSSAIGARLETPCSRRCRRY